MVRSDKGSKVKWRFDKYGNYWEGEDKVLGATWTIELPPDDRYNIFTLLISVGFGDVLHEERCGQFISVETAKDWIEKTGREKFQKEWKEHL